MPKLASAGPTSPWSVGSPSEIKTAHGLTLDRACASFGAPQTVVEIDAMGAEARIAGSHLDVSSGLPTEINVRSVKRLTMLATLSAALAGLDGVISHVPEMLGNSSYPTVNDALDLLGIVAMVLVSIGAVVLFRSERLSSSTRTKWGLAYLLLIAFLVALTDHADYFWKNGHVLHGMPVVVGLMIAAPVVVPMTPLRAFVLSAGMAATGPVAILTLARTMGYETPSAASLWSAFPGVAIVLATVLARIVHALGIDLKRARRVGAYALRERIGEGGMGEVYLAEHQLLRRPTAVKMLRGGSDAMLARFEREVRQTAKLTHPNTVTVYDYGRTEDGVFYYAMEHIEGFTLQAIVDLTGPMSPGRVVSILRQACGALREAHECGLIHRDVKPANLMLCVRGGRVDTLKVLDFGLVKELRQQTSIDKTAASVILGTPLYMAPEAIRDAEQVDARSDLYALGAVAYFLLCGQTVFDGANTVEVCGHHLHTRPEPPSKRLGAPLPEGLEALVLSCLEKAPADRPQSAAELRALLAERAPDEEWRQSDARAWWEHHGPLLEEARKRSSVLLAKPTWFARRITS